ncbi:MAG: hypothetical protein HYX47_06495 [Burkholderiales bacterium]|nr:hypothetical protein [Burkholderiales bacterium]
MPTINFKTDTDAAFVSDHSRQVILDILASAGVASCLVTSTVRNPAEQALAMYTNIEGSSVEKQKGLYGANGRKVIDEYVALKQAGKGKAAILAGMTAKINQLGPANVSRHCGDHTRLNVIDISPKSVSPRERFVFEVEKAEAQGRVAKFLSPSNGDPAYHLEIRQPGA